MRFDQGMSTSFIASVINCSTQTVDNPLNIFLETDDVVKRRGRDDRNLLIDDERHVLKTAILQVFERNIDSN